MNSLIESERSPLAFENAKITQIRANHNNVRREVIGWGIAKDSIKIFTSYWIFAPSDVFDFYWMHTSAIREIELGEKSVEFETFNCSIYRVEYLPGPKPQWITYDSEKLMTAYVLSSRQIFVAK